MGAREVTSPTINKRQEELNRKEAEKSKARAFLDQRVNILLGIEEDPAKIKAEIQETRQLEKRERESRKSVQAATANLYQQLKRRSGKKKGGR
jgi:predicted  nucleic acid-binding Zn-ribbon protein